MRGKYITDKGTMESTSTDLSRLIEEISIERKLNRTLENSVIRDSLETKDSYRHLDFCVVAG